MCKVSWGCLSRPRTAGRSNSLGGWRMARELTAPVRLPHRRLFALNVIYLGLLALSLTSCVNPDELDFTRTEPTRADLVGRWIPVSEPQAKREVSSAPTPEIELRGDGSFSAINLPAGPDVPGASKGLLSGAGVWGVDTGHDVVTIWVIYLDFANHYRHTINLRHQGAPYLIHISTGEFEAILLKRVVP